VDPVTIIGAGLAGSEAAWQLAVRGVPVRLVEMRPAQRGPAHHTDMFAELVCSNSFKSTDPYSATGLLKEELDALGSLLLGIARRSAVPAGGALAVDRALFSSTVTQTVSAHPLIDVVIEEATTLPDGDVIVAAGPLASEPLTRALTQLTGSQHLAFFDAAAPIVDADTIDHDVVFPASRWEKGQGADYLNCPMDRERYESFIAELVGAERVKLRDFERRDLFQACQPAEEVARTGLDALRYGALKPVGLTDPRTGERPWAVVQLRAENRERTAYNLVGFQTNLTFGAQDRVFRLRDSSHPTSPCVTTPGSGSQGSCPVPRATLRRSPRGCWRPWASMLPARGSRHSSYRRPRLSARSSRMPPIRPRPAISPCM